jgi:hypothetical protein
MTADPFERRVAASEAPCIPERRVSQQIERLCGERQTNTHDGSHRCYEHQGHTGPHRCACAYEWGTLGTANHQN